MSLENQYKVYTTKVAEWKPGITVVTESRKLIVVASFSCVVGKARVVRVLLWFCFYFLKFYYLDVLRSASRC